MKKSIYLLLLFGLLATSACKKNGANPSRLGVFTYQNDSTVVMAGTIGSKTPKHWEKYISAYPGTKQIIMGNCPGSKDDEANLEVARKVRQQDLAIHLPGDAEIASGAVDFYLAGTTRTRDPGSKIGVHAWSDGQNEATDFAEGHANHQPYIDYYVEMGFSQADAEAFYYFTIQSAAAAEIHWMTDAEVDQYGLVTE